MSRLSIVIPVVGDPGQLDDTLVSVLANRPSDCEILIVHNHTYNDPYELAGEVQLIQARRRAGFTECLNLGLQAAKGEIVNVISCGVEVCEGWADAAMTHFERSEVAAVAAVVTEREDHQRLVSAGLGYSADGSWRRIGLGKASEEITSGSPGYCCSPDALAAFYRTTSLRAIGGFAGWSHGESAFVDAAMALREAGFRCVLEPACLAYADAALARQQPGFRRGRDAERLFWRWAKRHGRVRSFFCHAALVAGECAVSVCRPATLSQLAGRAAGLLLSALSVGRGPKETQPERGNTPIAAPHFDTSKFRDRKPATTRAA